MMLSLISEKRDLAFNRELEQPPSVINILPTRELSFKMVDNKYRAELLITNKSKEDIVLFDIKCTAAASYRVQPRAGLLNPHAKKRIEIHMHSRDKLQDRANDSFMVRSCVYDGEYIGDESGTVKSAIAEREKQGYKLPNKKLKVYFEINDTVEKELALLRTPSGRISRQTTAAESDEFLSRSPSPYLRAPAEMRSVSQIIRRMSHVSRLNTALNTKDSFTKEEDDIFDVLKVVQTFAPTPSRPESPIRFKNASASESALMKRNTHLSSASPIKILRNQNKDSMESSPRTKKSVSIQKDPNVDFSPWSHDQPKPSQFKHNRPTSLGQTHEEDATMIVNNCPSVCDSSVYVSKEVEIYKRKLQALVKKYCENKKKLKQDEEEMRKMKTEINVLKLTGISKKAEDTTVKQSRDSYKMELWQFMILSITFLILGSALR